MGWCRGFSPGQRIRIGDAPLKIEVRSSESSSKYPRFVRCKRRGGWISPSL